MNIRRWLILSFLLINFKVAAQRDFNVQWPSISPDGKKVVYSRYTGNFDSLQIELFDLASNRITVLLKEPGLEPEWSPDGNRILFTDTANAIYIYDVKRKVKSRVIDPKQVQGAQTPAWSPEGSSILYGAGKFPMINIYRFNIKDQSSQSVIADSSFNYGPASSPKADVIALRHLNLKNRSERGIFLFDPKSKAYTQLAAFGEYPAWSPDGKYILFQGKGPNDKNPNIYKVQVDSKALTRLTDDQYPSESPNFQKNGKKFFYNIKDATGLWRIYSMDVDTGTTQKVPID